MAKSKLMVGARVRWTSIEIFEIDADRVGRSLGRSTETPTAIEIGTTGTVVVVEDERVRVVLDEVFRVAGEVDEVEWSAWETAFSARHIASRAIAVVGPDECPECGNEDGRLLDADYHHAEWTVFCVNMPTSEGETCGMRVFGADLSEESRLEALAAIERDAPILEQIREILGDGAGEWCGCHEGDMDDTFDGKARMAALRLLALVNANRAKSEEVA